MIRVLILTCLLASSASAQVVPLSDSTFSVPRSLLEDYQDMVVRVVPALQAAIGEYQFAVFQDSVIIARQQEIISMMEVQVTDISRIADLYDAELEKRKEIERVYAGEVKRLRWWRRAAVAAGIAGLTIAVVK